jgi:hypothetical protein
MRAGQIVAGLGLVLGFAPPAAAQTPCPPDGWFCDDGQSPPEPPPTEEDPSAAPEEDSGEWSTPTPPKRPKIVVHEPAEGRPESEEGSLLERRRARPNSPWGVNVRLEGVLLGRSARYGDTGMGGLGASLRYQPLPAVAVDLGLDLIGGTDYNGFDRAELMWSLSGLFYFNPRMPLKAYMIGGLNMSAADVEVIYVDGSDDQTWHYFGGHLGLGLQAELTPRLALDFDLTGFLRGRTDSRARREPEFIDSNGRMSNMSGGALLRGGLTFFW